MVKPTPWGGTTANRGAGGPDPEQTLAAEAAHAVVAERAERHRAAVRAGMVGLLAKADDVRRSPRMAGKWGYVMAAIGLITTFVLMFQHWMVAKGPDGSAAANAFGRIDAQTKYLTVWSKYGPNHTANLTGFWAVATSAAIAVTVFAVALYIITNSETLARTATIATLVAAILVVSTVLYLTLRQKHLKAMTARRWDLGGQFGSLMNWAFNSGDLVLPGMHETQYVATGSLTPSAVTALVISIGSAVTALAQWWRSHPSTTAGAAPWRVTMPWRINITRTSSTRMSASQDTDEKQPADASEAAGGTKSPAAPKPPAAEEPATDPPDAPAPRSAEGPKEPDTSDATRSDEPKPE